MSGCGDKKLRICGEWILVKMDPESDIIGSGLLIKPESAHDTVLRTGTVIDVGPGKWPRKHGVLLNDRKKVPVGVEIGEGVLFIKFLAKTHTAESIQQYLNDDEILLKVGDIILAYDRNEPPEFK